MSEDEDTEQEESSEEEYETGNARSGGNSTVPAVLAIGFILLGTYLFWKGDWAWSRLIIGLVVGLFFLISMKIANQWNEAVILRFGKYQSTRKAGIFFIIPFVDDVNWIDRRTQVMDVAPQEIMTSDSVPVEVDAVVYYKVKDSQKAIINVEDFENASLKLAQTTLRDYVGRKDLSSLLKEKEKMGNEIKARLDRDTDIWGIDVESVEIKDVILPKMLKRAMAKEAEATREKNARIIKADAEFQASKKFKEASDIMTDKALTLRQLQTWQEIGSEKNTMMIVVPSDLIIGLKGLKE